MRNAIKMKRKLRRTTTGLLLFSFVCFGLGSCTNNEGVDMSATTYYPSDPNQAVTFTNFDPTEGEVRTQMFIRGSNFGTDVSLISVKIGGREAKVISSNGIEIYCLVPPRADGGYVEVEIKNKDGRENVKHTFDQKFGYTYSTMVATLCGVVDDKGNSAITDGKLEVAGWKDPMAMILDDRQGKRDVYVMENSNCLRKIDMIKGEVSTTVVKGAGNWNQPEGMDWSPDRDTLWIADDQNNEKGAGVFYLLRKEQFSIPHTAVLATSINALMVHPKDGTLFIVRGRDAQIYKCIYNNVTHVWDAKPVGSFGYTDQWFYTAAFHPSGKYAYCVSRNRHYIARSYYDTDAKTLTPPQAFVGGYDQASYNDAPGLSARFNGSFQGCFVKNQDYVREGKEDVYDFYVTDSENHCVRKITPEGVVTTYAGRGSWSSDEIRYGYIDGDVRETARFNFPTGICYEESTGTFYIADNRNHRIRTIAVQ